MQAAIRFGKEVVTRKHEDFAGLFFINTLLGGYFGSRLMKNIREEKGLTYGISSSLDTLVQSSILTISTESSIENKDVVLQEIKKEMDLLQNTLISVDECEMVRNYSMGNLMMQLDGPFRSMDVVKTIFLENLSKDHFDAFVDTIKTITPVDIQKLSQKYLSWDSFHQTIVS